MTDSPVAPGSDAYVEIIDEAYDDALLKCMDIIGRNDFYGIAAARGLGFLAGKLALTPASHVLELCSGIGGPARFFARSFGCRVLGVDISAFNHRTAEERTKAAGLDHLVAFRCGNALDVPLVAGSFTHVFGCEAWCYFPDKVALYRSAWRALRQGGIIAFLESACPSPVRLRTAELLGSVYYESVADYAALLRAAGFGGIEHHDTTALACRDVASALHGLITRRSEILAAAGVEAYFALLEIWSEFLAYFHEGGLTHCAFIARKP
jgi:SAM-dependent methyltransferase